LRRAPNSAPFLLRSLKAAISLSIMPTVEYKHLPQPLNNAHNDQIQD
jgi:hypothetical protein